MPKPRVLTINLSSDEVAHCYHALAAQYRFHFAVEPDEGLSVALRFNPDIMVYEIGAPTDAAVGTFRRVKSGIAHHVPVISIAAENSFAVEGSMRREGIFYYLVKPFAMHELSVLLRAAIAYSNKGRI